MKVDESIKRVAEELDVPYDVCRLAYLSVWKFIREKVKELPLSEDLSEEEFKQLRPNFNLPSFGKFAVTWRRYQKIKNKFKYIKTLKQKQENDSKDKGNQTSF